MSQLDYLIELIKNLEIALGLPPDEDEALLRALMDASRDDISKY
jgi:hypothetical protein